MGYCVAMSRIAFIVDTPQVLQSVSPSYISTGEELARLVRRQLPINDNVRLVSITKADASMTAHTAAQIATLNATAVDVVMATVETITIEGAAAGTLTGITGLLATDTLVKVIKIVDIGQAVTDLTAEFTVSAAGSINNTGGTTTALSRVVVVWMTE